MILKTNYYLCKKINAMINKVMQVRIHKDNESQLLKDIEARKIELGLTSDNAYVRYLLKKDTREIAQNRLNESFKIPTDNKANH